MLLLQELMAMQHAASASSWQPASQLMGWLCWHGALPTRCCCLYLEGNNT
jgi:hypothetical protein